jgi:hypothetical protein
VLQNFRPIFQLNLHDPAMLNATILTFSLAVTGYFDQNCVFYHDKVLKSIRSNMSTPGRAVAESTLGAILLLAGVEVCIPFSSLSPA